MLTSLIVFAIVFLLLIAAAVGYWLFNYNSVMALQSRCEQASADIDVQIRQRHDLIPNIVQTVHNFVGMEKDSIDAVLRSRTEAMNAMAGPAKFKAEIHLGNNLDKLMSIADGYPELKSQREFAVLRAELSDMENKIAASRRFLNLATNEFNTRIRQFPGSLIAAQSGLNKEKFYGLGQDRVFVQDAPIVPQV